MTVKNILNSCQSCGGRSNQEIHYSDISLGEDKTKGYVADLCENCSDVFQANSKTKKLPIINKIVYID
jgi:hypothetical protein